MTTDSQLLDKAYALCEEGKFREAYDVFVLAANHADNPLEKAGILLNATTNLTQSDEQVRSRNQLNKIRELLGTVNPLALSKDDQDEFVRVVPADRRAEEAVVGVARPVGLEPTTSSFEGWHSIQLSYGRASHAYTSITLRTRGSCNPMQRSAPERRSNEKDLEAVTTSCNAVQRSPSRVT